MTNQLKTRSSTHLLRASQSEEAVLITTNRWKELHDTISDRIEDNISRPVISTLILVTSEDAVSAFIEYELIILSQLVSVSGNLTNAMVPFIASELISLFPNENVADFKLCFAHGARGDYNEGNKFFRLDGIVIRDWMHKYLEQKAITRENLYSKYVKRRNELENVSMAPAEKDVANKYLNQMLDMLKPDDKKVRSMTDEEIETEGQHRPKPRPTNTGYTPEQAKLLQIINRIRYKKYIKSGVVVGDCKIFGVNEFNILAHSQQDAERFYKIAHRILNKKS